jgi:serine protease AprX
MPAPRVQAALLTLADQRPDLPVGVIVETLANTNDVKDTIIQLGGVVTKQLPIIHAIAAELPAKAVLSLGKASGVRWVSLDAPMVKSICDVCKDTSHLENAYVQSIGASRLWNEAPGYLQGQGIGVAVVDSGVNDQTDLYTLAGRNRITAAVRFNSGYNQSVYDGYGHGNFVANIVGGNGRMSNGEYIGVAPEVNLINVKVTDNQGWATMSNVIDGLQWIYNNYQRYNIRVVNLSLNSTIAESYHSSPLDAALEILWFNKIVVVVSAGNNGGDGKLYPPANDPFVITVGAADDKGTPASSDDAMTSFSAYGTTVDGFAKPDLVAPGKNIVSSINGAIGCLLAQQHPDHIVEQTYFRMSGTSVASPIVAASVALLLQDEPNLNPDQIKYRLKATARPFDTRTRAGSGYLDIYAAVRGTTTATANTGTPASRLLWTGSQPVTWPSANWSSANWSSANWSSVNWTAANWSSVNWSSDYWGD